MAVSYKWLITDISAIYQCTQKKVSCLTDKPVYLTLYYLPRAPILHKRYKTFRGMTFFSDYHHDRSERIPVPQTVLGDTTVHHFWIPSIGLHKAIWYHFDGTYQGQPTASTSPDFYEEIPLEWQGVIFCEPWTWLGAGPPDNIALLFTEPWTWLGAGPPAKQALLFTELFTAEQPGGHTHDATNITRTSARLWGHYTGRGEGNCEGRFKYKKTTAGDWFETPWQPLYPVGCEFYRDIFGLDPFTEYVFYAQISNQVYSAFGAQLTFWTLP